MSDEFPHLRHLRESAQLTQVELAEQMGISQGFLSGIESGHKSLTPEQARAACKALGIGHKDDIEAVFLTHKVLYATKHAGPAAVAALANRDIAMKAALALEGMDVATKSLDPDVDATGLTVGVDGNGNYYIVDTTTDPPTITPVQHGDLVQQAGTPLGSKAATKANSERQRDALGRKRKD